MVIELKSNISNFLKEAYKHNKIKDLSEAFSEYSPELEWHMGRLENVINDSGANYAVHYEIGDIVFVNEYTYSNGEFGSNHLFVIIDQDNIAVPIEYFGMLISSNLSKLKFSSNVLLKKDDINHLNKDSLVKTDFLYRILDENILFKIGKVDMSRVEEYKKSFMDMLN